MKTESKKARIYWYEYIFIVFPYLFYEYVIKNILKAIRFISGLIIRAIFYLLDPVVGFFTCTDFGNALGAVLAILLALVLLFVVGYIENNI